MIVFDLKCNDHGHVFEAWFGSSTDYDEQRARGLLSCPFCGDVQVEKALMAPAVSPKGNSRNAEPQQPLAENLPVVATGDEGRLRELMQAMAQAQAKVLEGSTWVGRGFAEHARAMHYGEKDHSSIHGEVAPDEARALIAEGVEVAPLPFPVVPPEAKN
ncbi:MAG TPA: DUF1178 family protein [Sphingobium sp.]|nr:DUF1178 family protein [Sphingobium sp.]